jgi:hypothetical protein
LEERRSTTTCRIAEAADELGGAMVDEICGVGGGLRVGVGVDRWSSGG